MDVHAIRQPLARVTLWSLTLAAASHLRAAAPPVVRIEWDPETRVLIQEHGTYARMARLPDRRLVCVYDHQRCIRLRHSGDEGRTWLDAIQVARVRESHLTNADLLVLRDGRMLCLFNERPLATGGRRDSAPSAESPAPAYTIRAAFSPDGGATWSDSSVLYAVRGGSRAGCWEPAAVELPSGEVQVYFANEGPYPASGEQEITMRRLPPGKSEWSAPVTVSFRPRHRDGMPSPLVLSGGAGIAVAIEDNGLDSAFKPVIVHTSLADDWRSGPVGAASSNRWGALAEPLPSAAYAGAPFLRQLPSGETLLSYQQADDGNMNSSRMVVCIGDREARRFASPSCPFPQTTGAAQLWNALFVKDDRTVTALSSTTLDGRRGVWAVDGRVVRADTAGSGGTSILGMGSDSASLK